MLLLQPMKDRILSILLLVGHGAMGQVAVDNAVQLSGDSDPMRQVTGLRNAAAPGELANVTTIRNSILVAAEPMPPHWSISVPALDGPPSAGTSLYVQFMDETSGPLQLRVNGSVPYPVLLDGTTPLDGAALTPGTMLNLVFDGAAFQALNHLRDRSSSCPPGMVSVNDQFCIDIQIAPEASDFFEAADHCGSRGARLCSWAEFMASCVIRTDLGIAMTGQYEWVGSACNENGLARISGSSGCTSTACAFATGDQDRRFRCCTDR